MNKIIYVNKDVNPSDETKEYTNLDTNKLEELNIKESFENNVLDGIDIIYWVNLDRSTDRLISMLDMFNDTIFNKIIIERFSAFDAQMQHIHINKFFNNVYQIKAVHGCLLSHIEIIRKFNNSSYTNALILEDDCTLDFKKYWKHNITNIINNAPTDWDIIMLSYFIPPNSNKNNSLIDWTKNNNNYSTEEAYSTLSYIINQKGATKLLNKIYNNNNNTYSLDPRLHIDADRYIFQSVNTYTFKYPLFIYKTDNYSTTGGNIIDHQTFKESLIKNYNLINQGFTLQNENIDKVMYINLDNRTDRKEEIEKELIKNNIVFERFSAIKNDNGALGCSMSHLALIKMAKEKKYKSILIFEDDFEFIINKDEFHQEMDKLNNTHFDVCLLSYSTTNLYKSDYDFLYKIKDAQTTSGYIVLQHYYDSLISTWEESVKLLKQTGDSSKYTIDQTWKPLQEKDNWVCFKKRIGIQRPGYSDIEKINVNYGV